MRGIFREVVGNDALTRDEVIAGITQRPRFEHLGEHMRSGWGTVFKPLAWQGDLVFGPNKGTRPDVHGSRDRQQTMEGPAGRQ